MRSTPSRRISFRTGATRRSQKKLRIFCSSTVGKALKSVDLAVSIGRVERFVADWERETGKIQTPAVKPETGRKVAVIGAGRTSPTTRVMRSPT